MEELDELKDLKLSTSLSFSSSAAGGGGGGPSSAVRKGVAFFKLPSNADEVKREQVRAHVVGLLLLLATWNLSA